MKSIAIPALLDNYDIGGPRLDVAIHLRPPPGGRRFPRRVAPSLYLPEPGAPLVGIWPNPQRRFETRPKAPGFLHDETLWSEAMDQVKLGRLAPPFRLARMAL